MCEPQPPKIDVCAAVIENDGRFLLCRRPAGAHLASRWEFPGGKVDRGESLETCIKREIMEELGGRILEASHLHTIEHAYPEQSVRLHFLRCIPLPNAAFRALEHDRIGWFSFASAETLPLAPADRRFLGWWKQFCLTSPNNHPLV